MKVYNTLVRKKEIFKPLREGKVSFYHCGPTVYWVQHIGNLRGTFCGDVAVRTLRYMGYDVEYVRNYTDVGHLTSDEDAGEDKMEKGARREGLTPEEIAEKYIDVFEKDTKELNIQDPDVKPRATGHIKDIIDLVGVLLDKGYAYKTPLAVYFDVSKFEGYDRLSGQSREDRLQGAGKGEVADPNKKNKGDFALWFFRADTHKNALQYWPSPFESELVDNGNGFPGWHIECSAMAKKHLGESIDIHMGGIEHISIHHTNEIAQSEAAWGCKFANYWLHNEHLVMNNKKLAKSAGTGVTLSVLKEQGYRPIALRFFFLQAHYRSKQNFTFRAMDAAEKGLNHLYNQVRRLGEEVGKINNEFGDRFRERLADDLNTPGALAITSEMLKSDIPAPDKLATILDFDRVLGLGIKEFYEEKGVEESSASKDLRYDQKDPKEGSGLGSLFLYGDVSDDAEKLLWERQKARRDKDWQKADRIRDELGRMGHRIEDIDEGVRVWN